jgi:hypothetical protein
MPKDAFTLSDVCEPTLTIVCQPCGRRGRYNVRRLMSKHGNAKILYLLAELTNCHKAQSTNIYDRCKARVEGSLLSDCYSRCGLSSWRLSATIIAEARGRLPARPFYLRTTIELQIGWQLKLVNSVNRS